MNSERRLLRELEGFLPEKATPPDLSPFFWPGKGPGPPG